MALERKLQLEILNKLSEAYPAQLNLRQIQADADENTVIKNIHYLYSHQLIDAIFSSELGQEVDRPESVMITHNGMDFLADDGGLSAILGVVTVRLHEDTLRQIINAKIEGSDLSEQEKRPLLQAVRELPGEAIKHLSEKLLDLALDNLPGTVALIYKALRSAQGS